MRTPAAFAMLVLFVAAPASAEILYARPDAAAAGARYGWEGVVVPDPMPLESAIEVAKAANGSRALEIRLLHRLGAQETVYSVDLGSFRSALRWHGSADKSLVFRGQIDRSDTAARPLTVVVGRSLRETMCDLDGVDVCAAPSRGTAGGAGEAERDLLNRLTEELEHPRAIAQDAIPQDVRFRLHCFLLWESAFVEFIDMGFRDCWFAAVSSYASSNVSLRNSVIHGSTWAFLAVGRKAVPETAHSFEVTGNTWKQSPSAYRASGVPCDIHDDWNCPASVWSDLPWGIVHHHFWRPLNGALFMARDVLGNVKVSDNYLFDAYNGIRSTISDECQERPGCAQAANNGFEIVRNRFENIRDNPVEPENHAAFWIVRQNAFINAHAVISTDGVSGHDLLVFGNVFALDGVPGSRCRDEGWVGSRQFLARRGGGHWSTDGADGDDATCPSHRMGTAIKLGGNDANPDYPLLERILFFNNSLRTRSPLFRGSPAPPIASYNNAVEFTGCGSSGPISCRQEPGPEPSCRGKDVWTSDGGALFAECFPTRDGRGRALPHEMRFNAYNRAPGPTLDGIDKDRVPASVAFVGPSGVGSVESLFAIDAGSPLASGGCRVRYANGKLTCDGTGGLVGAVLPNRERFDVELPFGFPFIDVLRDATRRGSPR